MALNINPIKTCTIDICHGGCFFLKFCQLYLSFLGEWPHRKMIWFQTKWFFSSVCYPYKITPQPWVKPMSPVYVYPHDILSYQFRLQISLKSLILYVRAQIKPWNSYLSLGNPYQKAIINLGLKTVNFAYQIQTPCVFLPLNRSFEGPLISVSISPHHDTYVNSQSTLLKAMWQKQQNLSKRLILIIFMCLAIWDSFSSPLKYLSGALQLYFSISTIYFSISIALSIILKAWLSPN